MFSEELINGHRKTVLSKPFTFNIVPFNHVISKRLSFEILVEEAEKSNSPRELLVEFLAETMHCHIKIEEIYYKISYYCWV